jgi:hypothetical protein
MFVINDNKGFQITFDNGYTVSVQFGPGNYGSNYRASFDEYDKPQQATTVETALIGPDQGFVSYKGDDVQGYQNVNDVLELINFASKL